MIINRIEGANLDLGAPKNWDPEKDGPCYSLPVRTFAIPADEQGERFKMVMRSSWQPTPTELDALIAGAPIYLDVHAMVDGHPPVALTVGPAPEPVIRPQLKGYIDRLSEIVAEAVAIGPLRAATDEASFRAQVHQTVELAMQAVARRVELMHEKGQ